jgi:hypothetical protein
MGERTRPDRSRHTAAVPLLIVPPASAIFALTVNDGCVSPSIDQRAASSVGVEPSSHGSSGGFMTENHDVSSPLTAPLRSDHCRRTLAATRRRSRGST